MSYNFNELKNSLEEKMKWLSNELSSLRTGRATPALLDKVLVESYGSRLPMAHVASISIDDARTLAVSPWDASLTVEIEKAIIGANLGLSVNSDGKVIRVVFPELTSERRNLLKKSLKDKLEEARVAIRYDRDAVWKNIQNQEKDGQISEDEKFRYKDEMQKMIDEYSDKFEAMAEKKERELSG